MPKVRMTLLATCEYELKPDWYPEGTSPDLMVALEKVNILDDPEAFLDQDDIDITVEARVIEE